MSLPRKPQPAKLVIGVLVNDKALMPEVAEKLEHAFGAMDMISAWMDFDFTEYYAKEMGSPLYRRMMTFGQLIRQKDLPSIKLATNDMEQSYADGGRRCVNIDPGYLLYERFVLATGKNYSHRIYIGQRIYADLTLIFQLGAYQTLPWTYPDYADQRMIWFLKQVREKYGADLKALSSASGKFDHS